MGRYKGYSERLIDFLVVIAISSAIFHSANAQAEDFQAWTQLSFSKKINEKWTASVTPIIRFSDNASTFNDISYDWRLAYNFKNGVSTKAVFRTWTFKSRKPIYFFWAELQYVQNKENYKWVNLIRFHNGLDWVGSTQGDFLRWRHHYFHKPVKSKFIPFVGYDLWYGLNSMNIFERIWVEVGSDYKLDKVNLRLMYRRFAFLNDLPGLRRNIILTGLSYSF